MPNARTPAVTDRIQVIPDAPQVSHIEITLEDVEVVILRKYEDAHKSGDEAELARLGTALEVFREATAVVRAWHLPVVGSGDG